MFFHVCYFFKLLFPHTPLFRGGGAAPPFPSPCGLGVLGWLEHPGGGRHPQNGPGLSRCPPLPEGVGRGLGDPSPFPLPPHPPPSPPCFKNNILEFAWGLQPPPVNKRRRGLRTGGSASLCPASAPGGASSHPPPTGGVGPPVHYRPPWGSPTATPPRGYFTTPPPGHVRPPLRAPSRRAGGRGGRGGAGQGVEPRRGAGRHSDGRHFGSVPAGRGRHLTAGRRWRRRPRPGGAGLRAPVYLHLLA